MINLILRKVFIFFTDIESYFLLLTGVLRNIPRVFKDRKLILDQMVHIGVNSLVLVSIIGLFTGAVSAWQAAYQMAGLVPLSILGSATPKAIIIELGPVLAAIVLAGRVGASISAEIGTMKVTEQIDALEIMGVNSAGYLILPKILATVFFNPVLTLVSMFVGIFGGWLVGTWAGVVSTEQYLYGIRYGLNAYYITYAVIKTIVFAFIITSISSYYGYNVEGGPIEVGQCSTRAVVYSCVVGIVVTYTT